MSEDLLPDVHGSPSAAEGRPLHKMLSSNGHGSTEGKRMSCSNGGLPLAHKEQVCVFGCL